MSGGFLNFINTGYQMNLTTKCALRQLVKHFVISWPPLLAFSFMTNILGGLLITDFVYSVVVALPEFNKPHGFVTLGSGQDSRVT